MKRVLFLILLIAVMLALIACGTSKQQAYDFDGNWYSTKDGYLYVFTDGDVFCEENYVTLDNGKKTSGGYYEYENRIEAYIIETIGTGADVAPLYLIQGQETDMLCSDMEGAKVIFCRAQSVAHQIVQQNEEDKKQQAEQKTKEERDSIYVAPTVTYDSAISGNYTYQFVGIEGIITSYKYSDFINWYDFDFWCWSDLENSYICKKISLDADEYSKEDIEHLQKFDDGDKVKFVFAIRSDFRSGDWLDIPQYLFAELVEKGEISEFELHNDTVDAKEPSTGISTADTTDIAVRFETDYIDGDRLHITVFTKNNSDEIFTGNVYVTFYSADGKGRLGSDTIIVDELLPGRESWADVIVDAYRGTPQLTVDYSEVSFTPMTEVIAEIDTDATDKTKSSYYWNFDGVSWYKDITDIVAYKNGTCVVVLKDNPKEGGQFYASTIWSCGNDHGVDTVQVVDAKGTIIAVYGNGEMVSVSVNNGEIVSESNISTEVQGTETTESQTTSFSHSWNSGETTKKATCSETGIKTYTCLKCSEKETESIPQTDHTYDAGKVSKNPTCTDVGKITYTCSACKAQYSEDVEKIAHTWDNGKVKNAATCTLAGSMEYQCTTCGTTKAESIPLIAHSFKEQIVDDKYLCENATFTTGTKYYYSCFCGAKGRETFSLDNRRTWISWHEIVTDYDYTISYLGQHRTKAVESYTK